MYPELDFASLPFVPLTQRDHLSGCAAIYFALDSDDRFCTLVKPQICNPAGKGKTTIGLTNYCGFTSVPLSDYSG
jgi:hypothetical protein